MYINWRKVPDNIEKSIDRMKVLTIVFLIATIFFTYVGINTYEEYMRYKDVAIPVTATITDISYYNGEDADEYEIYVSYTYHDVQVKDVHWKTIDEREYDKGYYKKGSSVFVKIDPNNPAHVFEGNNGAKAFILSTIMASIMMTILTEIREKKSKCTAEVNLITDSMIVNEFKPQFKVYTAKVLFFIGSTTLFGKGWFSEVFSFDMEVVGWLLLVVGSIFQLLSIAKIKKMTERKIKLKAYKCIRKWDEKLDDPRLDDPWVTYTEFSGFGRTIGDNGEVGKTYYIVENGGFRQAYDVARWKPAIEDASLNLGRRKVITSLFLDLLVIVLFSAIYVSAIHALL